MLTEARQKENKGNIIGRDDYRAVNDAFTFCCARVFKLLACREASLDALLPSLGVTLSVSES